MFRVNWSRFILTLFIIIGVNYGVAYFLMRLGIYGLAANLIMSVILAFTLALINYPSPYRKQAFKDPNFHKMFGIFFIIFFLLNLIF